MAIWNNKNTKSLKESPNDYAWDDIRVPMENTKLNASKSEPAFEEWIDGIHAFHFENNNADDESLHFSIQIPHDWAVGTTLHPHLHWYPKSTNTGDVVWELDHVAAAIGDSFPASATTSEKTQAASGTLNNHQIIEFDLIDGKDLNISSMIHFRLTRLGGDAADTFTGDAIAGEFDVHYQRDSNGSYHEYQKLGEEYRQKKGTPKKPFKPGAW